MKKVYCDHCGREIKDGAMLIEIGIGEAHLEKHDLCRKCVDDYITWNMDFFESGNPVFKRRM